MRWIGLLTAVLIATMACRSAPRSPPPSPPEPVWVRVDGGPVNLNELARDKAICEATPFDASWCTGFECIPHRARVRERKRQVVAGCMAERGWILESLGLK